MEEERESTTNPAIPQSHNKPWVAIEHLSLDCQTPWKDLANWDRGRIAQANEPEWGRLVDLVEELVNRCLPTAHALERHTELIERLVEFCNTQAFRARNGKREPLVTSMCLQNLVRWAIDALRTMPLDAIVAESNQSDGTSVGLSAKAELWMCIVELADTALWDAQLRNDKELGHDLFGEIAAVMPEPPARLSWNILARVTGWFRADQLGQPVLLSLLTDKVHDGNALTQGLRYLEHFRAVESARTDSTVAYKRAPSSIVGDSRIRTASGATFRMGGTSSIRRKRSNNRNLRCFWTASRGTFTIGHPKRSENTRVVRWSKYFRRQDGFRTRMCSLDARERIR